MGLTVFANFHIDSAERLLRMKDSFNSFRRAAIDRWVVNARGSRREDALEFLQGQLGEKLKAFRLESGRGWFHDSRQMLSWIESDYVLFWIEDHICMCGPEHLDAVVSQMRSNAVEYLEYTWFGAGALLREFDAIPRIEGEDIIALDFDRQANALRQENCIKMIGRNVYIISCCGIFARHLFQRILMTRHPLFRRSPKRTPFDFEKRWDDEMFLPIRFGVPRKELFAAIDDDNLFAGDSLFSRGLYPVRVRRSEMLEIREGRADAKPLAGVRAILKRSRIARNAYVLLRRIRYHL